MTIVYRTDDGTRWGTGKGSNLTPTEFDLNNWDFDSRLDALESHSGSGAVGIEDFSVTGGNQLNVLMTDSSTRGPFTLPVATGRFLGAWQPDTTYLYLDRFTANNALYEVEVAHVSAATFDPGANDGMGHDYYALELAFPAVPVLTTTAASLTPSLSQANSYIRCTNPSGGCDVTIPSNASVPFPIGTELHFRDATGTGPVTFDAASPAAINPVVGYANQTATSGATVTLKKVDTDSWDIFGLLAVESGA